MIFMRSFNVENHFFLVVTLNLKKITSPSRTVYSLPYCLYRPSALTAFSLPCSAKSANFMVSAQIKPLSKSVWMTPAA